MLTDPDENKVDGRCQSAARDPPGHEQSGTPKCCDVPGRTQEGRRGEPRPLPMGGVLRGVWGIQARGIGDVEMINTPV